MTEEQKYANNKKDSLANRIGEFIGLLIMGTIASFLLSAIANFVFFPFVFFAFHDCGQVICLHEPGITWNGIWIVTVAIDVLFVIAFAINPKPDANPKPKDYKGKLSNSYMRTARTCEEENVECCYCNRVFMAVGDGSQVKCPYCGEWLTINSRAPQYDESCNEGLETDYYDEDMEGAPGYYGGE